MSDTETDGRSVSHDLHQDRPTKGTSDTGKPVRRTRSKPIRHNKILTEGKSRLISAILIDKPKSSSDNPLGVVLSEQAEGHEDNQPSRVLNDTDKTKQKRYVSDRGKTGAATARHISFVRRWKSARDVSNYSRCPGVRTWPILAQVITVIISASRSVSYMACISHIVTYMWFSGGWFCLFLASSKVFNSRAGAITDDSQSAKNTDKYFKSQFDVENPATESRYSFYRMALNVRQSPSTEGSLSHKPLR